MKDRLRDPDLARLFENTFPSTLDTTVSYFNADENIAFIITGVSVRSSSTWDQRNFADDVGYHVCSHNNDNMLDTHAYTQRPMAA
jgi:meiotically up-regulated gene 157 (Mug157) protein